MRPRTLDEFVGQQHFLGEGKLLRRLLKADRLGSVIFYGPPGTGKTTLARLLAGESRSHFQQLSAVTSGVKELREILDRGPRPALRRRPQDAAVHRRDPPLQQGPAGRAAARRRGRRGDPGRRDHGEPVLHHQQRAGQPQPRVPVRAALDRRHQDADAAGRWPTRSAGWAATTSGCTTTPWSSWPKSATATPGGHSRRWRSACCPATSRRSSSRGSWPRNRCSARRSQYDRQGDAHYDADQRADQEHSRQRSRRRAVLAGADARRGRGRAVSRPAAGDPGQRGRGQRRSRRAAAGRGRRAGLRVGRPARVPVDPGPGGDLSGLRREVERGHRRASARPAATCARAACCPCRSTCAIGTTPARSGWATAKATSTRTTPPDGDRRAGLPGRRARVLPARAARLRAGAGRAAGKDSRPAAGWEESRTVGLTIGC